MPAGWRLRTVYDPQRGEIWYAELGPIQGAEQAGIRPVLIIQNNVINRFSTTFLAIPLTTNLRRAAMPSSLLIPKGEGGLMTESVLLCHQMRALDKTRMRNTVGQVRDETLAAVESHLLFTLNIL